LLTPDEVSPSKMDDMVIARLAAMGEGTKSAAFNTMMQNIFGSAWNSDTNFFSTNWNDYFKTNNAEYLGKWYWRGLKPKGYGVVVWETTTRQPVSVIPPDDNVDFYDQIPMLRKSGNYSFEVYGFDQGVWDAGGGTFLSFELALYGVSPATLKGGKITDVLQKNIMVNSEIDSRDFPGGLAWETLSLKRWINIVDPLDKFLQALIDSIPIPPGIFTPLINWISRLQDRIEYWEAVLAAIQEYIDRILRLFDVGNTGFYFLGINEAAGYAGFVQRMKKVQAPPELTERPYCTGIVIVAQTDYGGQQLMDFLFDWCPSAPLPDEPPVPERPSAADIKAAWEDKLAADSQKLIEQAVASTAKNTMKIMADGFDIKQRLTNISDRTNATEISKDAKKPVALPPFFKKLGV